MEHLPFEDEKIALSSSHSDLLIWASSTVSPGQTEQTSSSFMLDVAVTEIIVKLDREIEEIVINHLNVENKVNSI